MSDAHRISTLAGLALLGSALLLAAPVIAQHEPLPPWTILDTDLSATAAATVRIGENTLEYTDHLGVHRSMPRARVLALRSAYARPFPPMPLSLAEGGVEWPDNPPRALATLADGQRFPGRPGGEPIPDAVSWFSPVFGTLQASLEDVLRVDMGIVSGMLGPPAISDDTVTLVNGDVVRGFAERFGDVVSIEVHGRVIDLPLALVNSVALANSARPFSGTMLWLTDGSVARVTDLVWSDALSCRADLSPTQSETSVPVDRVAALALNAARLVPLAALAPASHEPAPGRRWTEPPRIGESMLWPLGAADITIPGPMTVSWNLPADIDLIAGEVELPPECRVWGECAVEISVSRAGGPPRVLASAELSEASPIAEVRQLLRLPSDPPGPAVLRLTLTPGRMGPIQDRVVLRSFLLRRTP